MIERLAPNDESADRGSKRIKSVEIGYRVLLAVQLGPGPVKLSDVAKRCGLSTGAAHNYLVSLLNTGLVEQEGRGRYRLGPSAFALSLASFRQLNGYDVMRDAARALHVRTGQSTAVAVWSQGGPVSVYIQRSDHVGSFEFRSGHLPMLKSGAGLLFMAYLSERYTKDLVKNELEGAKNADDVADHLIASARELVLPQGYAKYDYNVPIPFALSAPIWTEDGRIPFVLSLVVHQAVTSPTWNAWLQDLLQSTHQASLLLSRANLDGPRSEMSPNPLHGAA